MDEAKAADPLDRMLSKKNGADDKLAGSDPRVRSAWAGAYRFSGLALMAAAGFGFTEKPVAIAGIGAGLLIAGALECIARALEWANEHCREAGGAK